MDTQLYEQALIAAARCGDTQSAATLFDVLMENRYILARARIELNKSKDRLARIGASLSTTAAWQDSMIEQLVGLPPAVAAELAKKIAMEKDPRVTPIALAVCAAGNVKAADLATLKGSPVPAVAALATPR